MRPGRGYCGLIGWPCAGAVRALQRLACGPTPRACTNAPSRCSGMRAHQLRALMRVRHRVAAACVRANSAHSRECPIVSRCSGLRAGQLRVLMRMRYLIALQRTVFGSTPRTYTTAPSYRVSAACVQASSAHSHECPIALQRHARTNRICPRLGAAACAQSVLRMGFSRRRCPRVYAPCVSPCRVFARSAVSALCRPCAVRQTPLSRAATDAPCSGCACQSSTGHTFRIPP